MHQQLTIEFDANRSARKSDPATSHEAARRAASFATSHAGRIHLALISHGPMSPKQMFTFTGLDVAQCDRRRKEMIAAGLVRIKTMDDGATVKHEGCEGCEVWEAMRYD